MIFGIVQLLTSRIRHFLWPDESRSTIDTSSVLPYPHLILSKYSSFNPAHRVYASSLRTHGIYHETRRLALQDPYVLHSANHLLCMLDAAWKYQLKHPGHWYMSDCVDATMVCMGFARLYRDPATCGFTHVDCWLSDASTPCHTSNWIGSWIRDFATISEVHAFEKAVMLLRCNETLREYKQRYPHVVLLAWIERALLLGNTIPLDELSVIGRYYALQLRMHMSLVRKDWTLPCMANVDAQYVSLQMVLERMETPCMEMHALDILAST